MINLMNNTYTANLSVILAEDVGAAELRNPKISGMRKTRKGLISRLLKSTSAGK